MGAKKQLKERVFHVLDESSFLDLAGFSKDLELGSNLAEEVFLFFWSELMVSVTSEPLYTRSENEKEGATECESHGSPPGESDLQVLKVDTC